MFRGSALRILAGCLGSICIALAASIRKLRGSVLLQLLVLRVLLWWDTFGSQYRGYSTAGTRTRSTSVIWAIIASTDNILGFCTADILAVWAAHWPLLLSFCGVLAVPKK